MDNQDRGNFPWDWIRAQPAGFASGCSGPGAAKGVAFLRPGCLLDRLWASYHASRMRPVGSFSFFARKQLASAALAGALVTVGCTPHTVVSAPSTAAPTRGISVSGLGKASGKPNVARSSIGVEARAGTAEAAIGEVNTLMARVITALKQAGVADADIRTATLSLNFERNYEQPPRPLEMAPSAAPAVAPAATPPGKAKPTAAAEVAAQPLVKLPQGFYNATNSVEVTIRNLETAGKVLSAATSAGANQINGLRFELEDPSPLQLEARKKAVADARLRAERLAELAGVKLGPAVSITEIDGGPSGPMPAFAMAKMGNSAPIESGELTITSTVQIVYALPE